MADRIINTEGMMEKVNVYVKKIIANPITIVDEININTIASIKQRLK